MKEFSSEEEQLAWFIGLVEGEGCFTIDKGQSCPRGAGVFRLKMTDRDVVEKARLYLGSLGIPLNMRAPQPSLKRNGEPSGKTAWTIGTNKASCLKIIIDQCYPYFSEKKQSDCDRVLKNLADRGLL